MLLNKGLVEKIVKEKNALVFTFIDPLKPFRQVDVFLTRGLSYETLIDSTELVNIDGNDVRILTKEKLILLKSNISPVRENDLFDIRALKKLISKEKRDGDQ